MKRVLLSSLLLLTAVMVSNLFTADTAGAAAIKSLAGCTDNTLSANDDGSTGSVTLPFTLNFFGTTYDSLFVNNNGNVTFDSALGTFTPFNLITTGRVIIAPFFADVDTRAGNVMTYGATTFGGRTAFCVNWVDVGYFSSHTDKLNSFQLLLIDRSDTGPGDFDIMFNYDQIQWETGDASDGTGGLGGSSARVGYSNGTDTALELPGSAVNGAFLDSSPSGLIHDSRDSLVSGRYLFAVRSGTAPTGGTISGQVFGDTGGAGVVVLEGAFVQICRADGFCNTTTTNALGEYTATGLADGQYEVTAFPPGSFDLFPGTIGPLTISGGNTLTDQDIVLTGPTPLPSGTTITSRPTAGDGPPVIFWDEPINLETTNCPGGDASYEVVLDGAVIRSGPMTEIAAGTYKATISAFRPLHGYAEVRITIDCPEPTPDKGIDFDIYIDPSGTVRTLDGDPIAGATVTLYRSDSSSGPFEVVPDGSGIMSPANRTNPDTTDAAGHFGWDVVAGFYIVRAEADGCVSPADPAQAFVETAVLTIPPPVTDLDLRLNCSGTPIAFGDANCDGVVNSIDAALVLQLDAGFTASLTCQDAADVNGTGSVNSIDAALILQLDAGLIPSLPV